MAKLQDALQVVASDLARFAAKDDYWSLFAEVFGTKPGNAAAAAIQGQLRRLDLSQLARVEVISAAQLAGAKAAYASASNTIYVSDRFLAEASLPELRAVLLEEIGHAIDARVNVSDRQGDEGELFSLLVRGITPTASERQRIAADDDRRTLTINGAQVAVETSAPVVYETTTIRAETAGGSQSYNYTQISGTNAVWQTKRGANHKLHFFNGITTTTIANSVYFDFGDLALSGANVAYTKSDGQDYEVYRYSGGVTTRMTTNDAYDDNLLIDGKTLIWRSYADTQTGEIYRNNGTTTSRVTTNTVAERDIQLSGQNLVWAAFDGNDYEIYLNDGTTTRALTNNADDDYSPVLSGNRVAWFQWNNNQENLFFYNGSTSQQVTTNLEISKPQIVDNNLVYRQHEASGDISLKFYNSSSQITSTLSKSIISSYYDYGIKTSSNLVAWLERGTEEDQSILKSYNGANTKSVNTFSSSSSVDYEVRGTNIIYLNAPADSDRWSQELYRYDVNSSSPTSTQLTVGEGVRGFGEIDVSGDRILWTQDNELKLTQPSTNPILSFSKTAITVVEGLTSPQTANLTVTLSAASKTPVTVRWETFSSWDDANDQSDYTSSSGVVTFPVGVRNQAIAIPILDDSQTEEDEVFYVRLSDPTDAVLVPGQTKATVTISDTWQTTGANGATFTLPASVENLTLTGSANINGIGNSKANRITGNSGNNRLNDGGTSDDNFNSDTLAGGLGDDTYIVNNKKEFGGQTQIIEAVNAGVDTVEYNGKEITFKLPDNVENLTLTGTSNANGIGNNLKNVIKGNSGDNSIAGGEGADRLTGLGGKDSFGYGEFFLGSGSKLTDSLLTTGIDWITDFDAKTGGDLFKIGKSNVGFFNAATISDLTAAAISAKLTSTAFPADFTASFQVGTGASLRSFVAINDGVAGFNQNTDAVIEVTGLTGTLSASNFTW